VVRSRVGGDRPIRKHHGSDRHSDIRRAPLYQREQLVVRLPADELIVLEVVEELRGRDGFRPDFFFGRPVEAEDFWPSVVVTVSGFDV
jgi:hypothetical protein